jgi:hypothetical protein
LDLQPFHQRARLLGGGEIGRAQSVRRARNDVQGDEFGERSSDGGAGSFSRMAGTPTLTAST